MEFSDLREPSSDGVMTRLESSLESNSPGTHRFVASDSRLDRSSGSRAKHEVAWVRGERIDSPFVLPLQKRSGLDVVRPQLVDSTFFRGRRDLPELELGVELGTRSSLGRQTPITSGYALTREGPVLT